MSSTEMMVYLDYNATTPVAPEVVDTIQEALVEAWANPSSQHSAGVRAAEMITKSRQSVANMISAAPQDIVFTSGGTEANNMILNTAIQHFYDTYPLLEGATRCTKGTDGGGVKPHFVTSNLEHDSIRLVLETYEREGTAEVTFVPASRESGCVEVHDVITSLRPTTCMVSIMMANNETGIIQPIAEICERVHQIKRDPCQNCRILLHTDAAQALGKIPVNVSDIGVDYLTIVGHKFYGPRIGAVYTRDLGRNNSLQPMFYGGGQERNYRPGTENTPMIAGLGKACQLVADNLPLYKSHMGNVRDYLEIQLDQTFPYKVVINGRYLCSERLPNTCSMSLLADGLHGCKVLSHLRHTQASIGAACHSNQTTCASPVLLASGVAPEVAINAIRLSVGRDTSPEDIDVFIQDLLQAVEKVKSSSTQ